MENFAYLEKIIILLAATTFVVVVFKRFKLSPVLGYLVAGALIGQNGYNLLNSKDLVVFAEFGVVFLLFSIGLELTFERLKSMRAHVFGFGSAQVILTSIVIYFICKFFGLGNNASVIIGGCLALSSTAIVFQVIDERNMHNNQVSRLTIANLILQDFAVVPLLVLVSVLANNADNVAITLTITMFKAVVTLLIILIAGRLLLRPLFNLIAETKSSELFVAITLLIVLGASFATHVMGMSLAMGAFIAGLLVAETQYQHQVEQNVVAFKGILMGLFFTTVGMGIDIHLMYNKLFIVIGLSLMLIAVKAAIIVLLCKLFRFSSSSSLHAGLLLAQGSEFAFIVFGLAASPEIKIIDNITEQILLTVVTLSMALTPILAIIGEKLAQKLNNNHSNNIDEEYIYEDLKDLSRHVIITGFSEVGQMVAKLLTAQKINYVVIESDSKIVKEATKTGFPVFRGDSAKIEDLKRVAIQRCKAVIVTQNDEVYLKRIVRVIHKNFSDIPIAVRSNDLRNAKTLKKIGASIVVPERYEAGLQLAGALLSAIGMSTYEVSKLKNKFRSNDYQMIQSKSGNET